MKEISRTAYSKPKPKKKKHSRHLSRDRAAATTRKYYRVSELAAELGTSPHTVWAWVRKGVLPSVRIGGAILLDRARVKELISQRYSRDVIGI